MPLSVRLDGRASSHRHALEQDFAGVGRQHAGDEIEERGLAGAVRADQGVDVAGRHLELQIVERVEAAETLGQPLDRKAGGGGCAFRHAGPSSAERQPRQRIAREQPVRPHDHHHDQDDAVGDQPLGVLEIEEVVQEIVDAVHRIEIGPRHRHQLAAIRAACAGTPATAISTTAPTTGPQ